MTFSARQKITSELLKVRTELLQNYNSKRGDLMAKELEVCPTAISTIFVQNVVHKQLLAGGVKDFMMKVLGN